MIANPFQKPARKAAKPRPVTKPLKSADRDISGFLQAWRTRQGLTQVAAARLLRVSFWTLVSWEQGNGCALPELVKMAVWYLEQKGGFEEPPLSHESRLALDQSDKMRLATGARAQKKYVSRKALDNA